MPPVTVQTTGNLMGSRKFRGTTTGRGYGRNHQVRREAVKRQVLAGEAVCARCGKPILPTQAFDLGHVDGSRVRYAGPEHRHARDCPEGGNRATSRLDRATASRRNGGGEPVDYLTHPGYQDDEEKRVFWSPPAKPGEEPRREWSQAWWDWRAEPYYRGEV